MTWTYPFYCHMLILRNHINGLSLHNTAPIIFNLKFPIADTPVGIYHLTIGIELKSYNTISLSRKQMLNQVIIHSSLRVVKLRLENHESLIELARHNINANSNKTWNNTKKRTSKTH